MLFKALRALGREARRFRRDTAGNFAMMFGIALIPLVGAVGAAIDYSNAARVRSQLQDAADAASVGAIARASRAFNRALGMNGNGNIAQGRKDALALFNADVAGKKLGLKSVEAVVSKNEKKLSSTVTFSADAPAAFLGIFGLKSIPVQGSSVATDEVPVYVDFYLLLDNSPSMGVGATTTDIDRMVANTADKCAFACHDTTDANNYYNLAKKLGVTTRIDVLRQATQKLMTTASEAEVVPDQFRMAIATFGFSAATMGLTEIAPITADLDQARDAAAKIDLMTVDGHQQFANQDTDFDKIFPAAGDKITKPGSGSMNQPQKVLFFVSDGVADANNPKGCSKPLTGTRCQEPIDLALCKAIKKRDIKIAVLHTTYLPLPTNDWYNKWIAPFAKEIGPTMEDCASPGLYFEVSPTEGVSQAMDALFVKAVSYARLTQ